MVRKRIVVTGMGVVSCFGQDVGTYYESLLQGKSGVVPIPSFDCTDYPTTIAALVQDFSTDGYIDKKQARRVDPFIAYTLVAGKKALEDAQFTQPVPQEKALRYGVMVGSGIGGMCTFYNNADVVREKGPKVTPFLIPYILTNMGGALLGIDTGFMGPNYSVSTACATSNYAFVLAAEHIRRGEADLIVCGGAEAPISPMGLAGFCAVKALSKRNDSPQEASRPFDQSRDGFVMGEGAGILVLEELEHALCRGAPIYAEYMGGAMTCDGYHMTDPREDGLGVAACIKKALSDAGCHEREVNYVNAHATSTPVGDLAEICAMNQVFSKPEEVWVNATKSMIGHGLGAAGGLEAIATIMAIKKKKIHPTRNLETPEESIRFRLSKNAEDLDIQAAVSNSFGFGGHNATVVFKPYSG